MRSVALIAAVLGRGGERGQQRRLAEANKGHVSWRTPPDVSLFMTQTASRKETEAKAAINAAKADGTLTDEDKPARREDFLTDEELLREMFEGNSAPKE